MPSATAPAPAAPATTMLTSLPSSVIWRDDPNYEEARIGRVFNHRRPDRYPHGVVEAICVEDVVAAVKLAQEMNLHISVRSGGHSWAAWSVRNDAILVDLGNLNLVELNEATGIARVSPSTTGGVLNKFLATKGKMFGGGHCPDVGLGGFLLQGGMGWNCRNWGWACEKLVAVEVVTADGQTLLCNKEQNMDLLWAARGAGPGFPAIVTAFHLEVRNSFSVMRASTFMWPLSEYKAVMDWSVKTAKQCDGSIEIVVVGLRPDPAKDPVIMSHTVTFQNTEEAAIASLKLVNETHPTGAFMESMCRATSLEQEYCDQAGANPVGLRYASDNAYIENDADVADVLREAFMTLPENSKTFALWYSMNPCSRRELPDMAASLQSDHYFALYTVWELQRDDKRCKAWVKDVMTGVEKHSVGAYLGDSDFQVRRTKFWEDSKAEKLMEVRRKWDPSGRICGYLDEGDKSLTVGMDNVHQWQI